ncbi:hypothetical protein AVEN_63410-1 [Araneus ventricosus]|uniref:Uncharacterized protein n=1 Tax=Araneus ventricosus TaxID=182803 RepID=A0A4Y2K5I3_ARAVE|nr:hypothetical protein AVEN_63410-1 [Araneus ventricosus]
MNETWSMVIVLSSDKYIRKRIRFVRHSTKLAVPTRKDAVDEVVFIISSISKIQGHFSNIAITNFEVNAFGEHFSNSEDTVCKTLQERHQDLLQTTAKFSINKIKFTSLRCNK